MDALKLLTAFVAQQNKKTELKTRVKLCEKERPAQWLRSLCDKQNARTRAAKARLVAEIKRLMELDKGE